MDPTRARPVPFCRHSLRPAPLTSLLSLVLCVPRRSPARYQREASCSRFWLTSAPNTASANSTEPTFLPLRLTTSTTGIISSFALELLGLPVAPLPCSRRSHLADKNVLPARPGHRSTHQQQVFVGVHLYDFQVLGGHLLIAHVARKMLVLPHPRRKRTAADAAWRAVKHRAVG